MLKYFVMLLFFLLFITKSYVFYLNKYYVQMQQEYENVKKELKYLSVEWIYLNQPNRVQELSKKLSKDFDKNNKV